MVIGAGNNKWEECERKKRMQQIYMEICIESGPLTIDMDIDICFAITFLQLFLSLFSILLSLALVLISYNLCASIVPK